MTDDVHHSVGRECISHFLLQHIDEGASCCRSICIAKQKGKN